VALHRCAQCDHRRHPQTRADSASDRRRGARSRGRNIQDGCLRCVSNTRGRPQRVHCAASLASALQDGADSARNAPPVHRGYGRCPKHDAGRSRHAREPGTRRVWPDVRRDLQPAGRLPECRRLHLQADGHRTRRCRGSSASDTSRRVRWMPIGDETLDTTGQAIGAATVPGPGEEGWPESVRASSRDTPNVTRARVEAGICAAPRPSDNCGQVRFGGSGNRPHSGADRRYRCISAPCDGSPDPRGIHVWFATYRRAMGLAMVEGSIRIKRLVESARLEF